jgi:hypothetical protein
MHTQKNPSIRMYVVEIFKILERKEANHFRII